MNAKQEILDALEKIEERYGYMSRYAASIRAILSTHTLEPIDDRPFDPTLCGFRHIKRDDSWRRRNVFVRGAETLIIETEDDSWELPRWPTQSEGTRLFKLLGVLG